MKIRLVVSLIVLVILPSISVAGSSDKDFKAGELKIIRNVSQTILKVRGQKRQNVEADTKPLREEINQLRRSLEQALVALDAPSITFDLHPAQDANVLLNKKEKSIWDRVAGYWNSEGDGGLSENSSAKKINKMFSKNIEKAKIILSKRKSLVAGDLPSFWQIWKTADKRKVRLQKTLINLEDELQIIDDGVDRRTKLKALISKLGGNKSHKYRKETQLVPTIQSLTKLNSK